MQGIAYLKGKKLWMPQVCVFWMHALLLDLGCRLSTLRRTMQIVGLWACGPVGDGWLFFQQALIQWTLLPR
eukprot:scaffold47217_cov19-Tisochrysis_lutea.AAC.1